MGRKRRRAADDQTGAGIGSHADRTAADRAPDHSPPRAAASAAPATAKAAYDIPVRVAIDALRVPGGISAPSLSRWVRFGIRGRDGALHRLPARKIKGHWYTNQELFDEWIERTRIESQDFTPTVPARPLSVTHAVAEAELERMGA